jgi:cyclic dehypoxanthinyl futalosine synthase
LTLEEIRDAISELGYTPRQRNVFYQLVGEEAERLAIEANRGRPGQPNPARDLELAG